MAAQAGPLHGFGMRIGAHTVKATPGSGALLTPALPSIRRSPRQRLHCTAAASTQQPAAVSAGQVELDAYSYAGEAGMTRMTLAPASQSSDNGAGSLSAMEVARRRKISVANRGRTPWNKGKAMSPEMREKISRRTFEAMQRPEVKARMAEANQHRPPHRAEVRQRISTVLKQRAAQAAEVLDEQCAVILALMQDSSDEEQRLAAEDPELATVAVRAVAWRLIKRDWHEAAALWTADKHGFRTLALKRIADARAKAEERIEKAAARKAKDAERKGRTRDSARKVRSALDTQKKLTAAKLKLAQVEAALLKLSQAVSLQNNAE